MAGLMLECAVCSDVGRVRAHNEDAVFASPRLAAVADGVGGAAAGEVASATVINALIHLDKCLLREPLGGALEAAVRESNEAVAFIAACRPAMAGMGTTLTAVALGDEGCYTVANVGDSRTYLLRDGDLHRLTRDETLVQTLVDAGELSPAEARRHPQRSVVLQALDGDPRRTATLTGTPARPGDRLLLCSDGLSDVVDDDALAAALSTVSSREDCARRLIDAALAAGSRDNVSAIVADVVPRRDRAAAWAGG